MRSAVLGLLLIAYFVSPAFGWGYIFNRFRPEANSNWGYGSVGGTGGAASANERLTPRQQLMEALIGEELLEEEVCSGRRCTSNEHCCPGHVCIDFDSGSAGSCMPVDTERETVECTTDVDCGDGHSCEMGNCTPSTNKKRYNEPCMVSSECDFGRGLCCQLIRRHRQAPRKMCSYFKDPLSCIGHMEPEAKRTRPAQ